MNIDDSLFLLDKSSWSFKVDEVVLYELEPIREAAYVEGGMVDLSEVNQLVITRGAKMCNFLDYKEWKIVYKRFASLYFITIVDKDQN